MTDRTKTRFSFLRALFVPTLCGVVLACAANAIVFGQGCGSQVADATCKPDPAREAAAAAAAVAAAAAEVEAIELQDKDFKIMLCAHMEATVAFITALGEICSRYRVILPDSYSLRERGCWAKYASAVAEQAADSENETNHRAWCNKYN